MQARLGDHGPAVGVADQDDRAVQFVDDPAGGGGIVFQGQGRVLHDGDAVAVRGERVMHPLPAGAVDEPAVHQHHVACP
jgi:hypothetical protein